VFGTSGRFFSRKDIPLSVVKINDPTQLMQPVVGKASLTSTL